MTPIVLVPLDGSPDSEQALPWAMKIAAKLGGAIRLVGVHAPPAVFLDGATMVGSLVPDEAVREKEQEYFDQLEERIRTSSGASVSSEIIEGSVIPVLVEYTEKVAPYAVVMTSRGRGAVARFFLGSTAREFVRQSPVPVLLIHPDEREVDFGKLPPIEHITLPFDGSELSEKIISTSVKFGKMMGADFALVMCLDAVPDIEAIAARHEPGLPGPWDPSTAGTKAGLYLEHLADKIRAQSLRAGCHVVPHGKAEDAIIETAKAKSNSIIAMATHGRGGLSKVVWGSVADAVIRKSPVPVLILKSSV